jgi:hypothetical protein
VYVLWVLSGANWGGGGLSGAKFFSRLGIAGESFFELLPCSRRKGRNFFLIG